MADTRIQSVTARQIIDCKCRPLVEVDVTTAEGVIGRGCAPTGSSVGMYEAFVLRDHDPNEYDGLSVHKAVDHVIHQIGPALIGMDVMDQEAIDRRMIELDGTENKERLGGNAIYSVSIACYRAAAASRGVPLYEYIADGKIRTVPVPSFNVINGGRYPHLTQAFNEFIVVPYRAETIEEAVEIGVEVFKKLGTVLEDYLGTEPGVGGSYGWIAPSEDPEVVLSIMQKAIDSCGYHDKVAFALDCASSEMYDAASQTYYLNGKQRSSEEMIDYMKGLTEKFPFLFVEDMLDENDWGGYRLAHQKIQKTNLIGDDFIVTNRKRLERAVRENSLDGFILKPNQVGTISEAMEAYRYAKKQGLFAVPSGRSGGVISDVVMDLAVGLQVDFIKNGCPKSGERIDKLNFLIRACSLHEGCHLAELSHLVRF